MNRFNLFVLLFLLASCSEFVETFEQRIFRQAKQYCSCRKGVDILTFNPYDIYLLCKDGTEHKASGSVREHQIHGCEK